MSDSHPDWIDKVAKLAGRVGMNPTQVRWKLIRWHDRRQRAAEAPSVPLSRRLGILMPEAISISTVLALVMMATFARVWVAQGGGFAAPKSDLLLDFGAFWYRGHPDEYWRALTAMFLHIGFWHIAFNLIAIATVGPQVEQIWGRLTLLFIFIITGLAGFAVSAAAQPNALTAGASGGVCGLIGAAAGWGQRLGTTRGRLVRNDMVKWLAYTIVFGFAVGANNWAHAGGAALGFIFGYLVPQQVWKRVFALRWTAGAIGVAGTAAAVAIIMTRQPKPAAPSARAMSVAIIDFHAQICRIEKVSPGGGQALLDIMLPAWGFQTTTTNLLCREMASVLQQCREGGPIEGMSPNDRHAYCDPIVRAFSEL